MKRTVLGGIVSVLLVVTAILVMYLMVARTTSGFRLREFDKTVAFMSDRIDALEKQRDLLKGSAAALEKEIAVLNKRIRQTDVEIQSMKDLVSSAKTSIRYPLFRWSKLRITAGSSILMIAFLALIWLLYSAFIKSGASPDEDDDETSSLQEVDAGARPRTGSVLEEEYQLPSESAASETGAPEDESPGDDNAAEEDTGEVLDVTEPEKGLEDTAPPPDADSPSLKEKPGDVTE
jgi:cytoskeletal protein RodZ